MEFGHNRRVALYDIPALRWLVWRLGMRNPRLRRFVTSLVVPNQNRFIDLLGARIFVNRRSEIGYWRAAQAQRRNIVFADEVPTLLRVAALIEADTTFVDCGANIGLFTAVLYPLRRLHPGLTFHAFEPHPDTFARLKETLRDTDTKLENVALSNAEGALTFASAATSGAVGVPHSHFQIADETFSVPCRRLDRCEIAGNALFLKVDVEGHELEVLEGAQGLFDAGRVTAVFVDGALKERETVALLERHGYLVLNIRSLEPYRLGDHKMLAVKSP
jgi:FkbM family methyltransferase